MNILVTLFEIQDYGGIAQSHELMMKGLMEEGHEVEFVILRPNDRDPYINKTETHREGTYPSVMGGFVNTLSGWYGQRVMSYGSAKRIREWNKFASEFDLIIHQIPVPRPDEGQFWRKIYDTGVTQIAWIHDANFRDLYPHLALVADRLVGVTTSNQAGYESAAWLPIPRAFMGVPHELLDWKSQKPWGRRKKQAVCAHVWKAWKRMHLAVQAQSHVTRGKLILGGDGIEARYMRSKDKCKPKYAGMWKRATQKFGMDYRGLMTHDELFALYGESRVMVDLSYSRKFAALGSHFNRSTLEAFNCGLVPVVTDVNMVDNFDAQRTIWKAFETHIPVHHESGPEGIAGMIDHALSLKPDDAETIVSNGRRILRKFFGHRSFARDLIRLSYEEPCGVYPRLEVGESPPEFMKFARKYAKENAK